MISVRRIFHLRISPVHSLPSTSAYFMSMPICNRLIGVGNIHRQVLFDGPYNYEINPRKQLTEDQIERIQRAELYEEKERHNRESATVALMLNIFDTLATEYLLDEECRSANGLTAFWDEEDDSCYKYWMGICKHSKTPLAINLREKLHNSGLQYEYFCRTIVEFYFTLERCPSFDVPYLYVKPKDVLNVIDRLGFNHAYDCLKIVFSLHKIYGIKI